MEDAAPLNREHRVILVGCLSFAAMGLATGLLGLAWPSMRAQFGVQLDAVNQIFVVSTAAYLLVSVRIGRLMDRIGSALTVLAGSVLLMSSSLGTAAAATWAAVVAVAALAGAGTGLIDSGVNLYIATHHGPRPMVWAHACFGLGATAGPLVMAWLIQRKLPWQEGYIVAGLVMAVPAALAVLTFRDWRNEAPKTARCGDGARVTFADSARVPAVWLGAAMFGACVGLELAVGQWAYTLLWQARGMRPGVAGVIVGAHWGVFTGSRIVFGFVAGRFDLPTLLRVLMGATFGGAALFWWNPTPAAGVLGLLLLGFAEAPVFPLLMSGTGRRVGEEHTANAVGLQMVAAGAASAAVPGAVGTAGKLFGLPFMAACFVVLAAVAWGICLLPWRGRIHDVAAPDSGEADHERTPVHST